MKRLLILKAGTAAPAVRVALGDYDRWFVESLGTDGIRFRIVQAELGEPLPSPAGHDAVIVTGSPHSVTARAPWMARLAGFLREAAAREVPVLGVCFGHQLLAHAFGAEVRRAPAGRELGTIACALTAAGRADPLFDGIPPRFEVQATHEDQVEGLPAGADILAANAHTAIQAFRIGRSVRAVQFHPEVDAARMRAMVEARLPALEAAARARGEDPRQRVRAILGGIHATPHGGRVLRNFVARFT